MTDIGLAGFIDHWVRAYKASRAENDNMVGAFAERMRREFELGDPSPSDRVAAVERGSGWLAGEARLSLRRLAREMWREGQVIAEFLRHCRHGRNLLVISDTRRLAVGDTPAALAATLRPLNRTAASERFAAAIGEKDAMLLFSPNLTARPVRGGRAQIGYLGLATLLVLAPVESAGRILGFVATSVAMRRFGRAQLFWGLIAALMDTLLVKAQIRRTLLLTGNSYAVELFRWRALLDPSVEAVTEIQHGVPTRELIEYYEDMLKYLPPICRERFELVPIVPAIGLDFGGAAGLDFAVNLKFREFAGVHDAAELAARLTQSHSPQRYRVAINGGATNPVPYFDSDLFRIERELISEIRAHAAAQSVEIEIAYTIHPSHLKSGLAADFGGRLEIDRLWSESMDSWLTADLCVSLISSSVWDARYLGAATFIAVREADRLYPAAHLRGGHHVGEGQRVVEALRLALEEVTRSAPITQDEISRRIEKLYSVCAAPAAGDTAAILRPAQVAGVT